MKYIFFICTLCLLACHPPQESTDIAQPEVLTPTEQEAPSAILYRIGITKDQTRSTTSITGMVVTEDLKPLTTLAQSFGNFTLALNTIEEDMVHPIICKISPKPQLNVVLSNNHYIQQMQQAREQTELSNYDKNLADWKKQTQWRIQTWYEQIAVHIESPRLAHRSPVFERIHQMSAFLHEASKFKVERFHILMSDLQDTEKETFVPVSDITY
ncbi:MAG: hypothetical protein AAF391_08045, partial [Bacteroidota bacterium]